MARPKSEAASEPELITEPADEAVTSVRILAFKVDTSRCMALEGDVIDLPVSEAKGLIAEGKAEAHKAAQATE